MVPPRPVIMISKDTCIDYILHKLPEFQKDWESHRKYWGEEQAGLCNDINSFTRYTIESINSNSQQTPIIFSTAEELMEKGDQDVKTAVATCFLENLINAVSAKKLQEDSFVKFLGKKSKAYCKKWDEFTGAKTNEL